MELRENACHRIQHLSEEGLLQVVELIDALEEYEPNEETIAAFEEAKRLAHDPNAKRYKNFSELLEEINAEIQNEV